ncbi:MAG: hypothetical protein JSR89_17095 [Proteobacteria bacterium]|nr:hypothetical protein [Pseudomonadota bacterium]
MGSLLSLTLANERAGWALMQIATSSWFIKLDPAKYQRIGISRGVPRGQGAGYKRYPKLNPGPWFNAVDEERYKMLYWGEILSVLNPETVRDELIALGDGKIPVLLCFEPATPGPDWCHRGMVSAWFHDTIGLEVPEVTKIEEGFGWSHPKLPPRMRQAGKDQLSLF